MEHCGGAFGSGAFGGMEFGSGIVLGLERARASRQNAIDVTFSVPPHAGDPFVNYDVLNLTSWTLEVVSPATAILRIIQSIAETADPRVIRVYVDGPLEREAIYRIGISELVEDVVGLPIDPLCRSATFRAFGAARVPTGARAQDVRADLANPQLDRDRLDDSQPLGSFQRTSSGDYALEHGQPYLRKRIIRRASTAAGAFFHLVDYGFAEPLKSLITPDTLRRIQARAHAQVLREPDVLSASVAVSRSQERPNLVILKIQVTTTRGELEVVTVPIEVSP